MMLLLLVPGYFAGDGVNGVPEVGKQGNRHKVCNQRQQEGIQGWGSQGRLEAQLCQGM